MRSDSAFQGIGDAVDAGPAYAAVAETVIAGLQGTVESEMTALHGRVPGGAFDHYFHAFLIPRADFQNAVTLNSVGGFNQPVSLTVQCRSDGVRSCQKRAVISWPIP